MATLFNTKISATYEGLLKTVDNAVLNATLRELSDGSGNLSGLFLNTAGDFKVSNILEWGSLKDTGTGVTITRYVTSTDGIENFDNNTSLPTSAAVKLYVDSKFATSDTLQEVLSFGNTTGGNDIVVSASDDITFTDSSKAIFGAGSDLQIYHDGSNSYINEVGTGFLKIWTNDLEIQSNSGTETLATFATNGAVSLYYDDVKRFETLTDGSKVTGNLVVTGTITGAGGSFLPLAGGTMTGNIVLNDNVKSIYGTGSDLEIFHDGISSYIKDVGTGSLNILGSGSVRIKGSTTDEFMGRFNENGSVQLYYDNAEKLVTSSTGVAITGALSTTTNVSVGANATFVDNGKALFGAGSDLQIYHDGSNSLIADTGTGLLNIRSNEVRITNAAGNKIQLQAIENSSVKLYFNNTERFYTSNAGAVVTGDLTVTGTITGSGGSFLPLAGGTMTGDTLHGDNVKSIYGAGSDLEIYHDGSNSRIVDNGTGELRLQGTNLRLWASNGENYLTAIEGGSVSLYYSASKKFETTNIGVQVSGSIEAVGGSIFVYDGNEFRAGDAGDLRIGHDATNSYLKNNTGDLYINQAAVTKSILFKVSDANALDTTALTISRNADASFGRDVTIAGDLTVNGTTTTVNSQTLAVVDPLIQLAKDNTANSLDIGLYGDYNDGTDRFLGLFSDASDSNKFKLFKGTTVEPTTTVDIGGAGYVAADLQVAGFEASTGNFTGDGDILSVNRGSFSVVTNLTAVNHNIVSTGKAFNIKTSDSNNLTFLTNNTTALTLDTSQNASFSGDVGIGQTGNAKLEVLATTGEVFRADSNGGAYRLVVNQTGANVQGVLDVLGSITTSGNGTFGGAVNVTSSVTPLTINRTGGATALIGLNIAGTNRGLIGATSTKCFEVYNTAAASKFSILNGGDATFAGNVAVNGSQDALTINTTDTDGPYAVWKNTTNATLGFVGNANSLASAGNTNFAVRATNDLIFASGGGTERLRIDSSGNSTFAGNITGVGATFLGAAASGSPLVSIENNSGSTATSYGLLVKGGGNSASGKTFEVRDDSGNTDLIVTGNGNVAIGTDTPTSYYSGADNLVIKQDSGEGGMSIVTANDTSGALYFADGTSGNEQYRGGIGYTHLTDKLFLVSGGQTRVWMDDSGDVGIGTDDPNYPIDVNGIIRSKPRTQVANVSGKLILASDLNSVTQIGGIIGTISFTSDDSDHGADFEVGKIEVVNQNPFGLRNDMTFTTRGQADVAERMRIQWNGNVGIGTDSPRSITNHTSLTINGTSVGRVDLSYGGTISASLYSNNSSTGLQTESALPLVFGTNNTERMRITSGGEVGIGTEYVSAKLQIHSTNAGQPTVPLFIVNESTTIGTEARLGFAANTNDDVGSNRYSYISTINTSGSNGQDMIFATNATGASAVERMRITSGGDILFRGTSVPSASNLVGSGFKFDSKSRMTLVQTSDNNNLTDLQEYFNTDGAVGKIQTNGTATLFTTSSDYRLKEDLQNFNGLEKVSNIKVYDFKWKTNGRRSYGVMAHELQEVLPQAVGGEKNAIKENGEINTQTVDYSKIVPLLVKSIQELKAEVDLLKQECKCKN